MINWIALWHWSNFRFRQAVLLSNAFIRDEPLNLLIRKFGLKKLQTLLNRMVCILYFDILNYMVSGKSGPLSKLLELSEILHMRTSKHISKIYILLYKKNTKQLQFY